MKKIKVFISSPSDVEQERSIAMTVLNRLNRRYKEHLEIEGIFWKDKPLFASDHFQGQIEDPSTADIVVVILWSRLGTNLSLEYKGKISGKQPVTGTEWEFEDAMSHYKSCGKPEVIVYKKNSNVFGVVGDKEEYDKKSQEKADLDDFMKYWFVHNDGSFKAAFHQFEELEEFENRLETHLEELIKTYLKKMIGEETRWFKGSPFRGLNPFELEHEDIFFGRREQIYQIRTIFLNLEKEKHPFLLVVGASGCGKSSLLKAGVLPYLLQSDIAKNVAIIKHSIFKPNDNPTDLLLSLSTALFRTFEEELRAFSYSQQTLKEALLVDIKPIEQAINKIRYEKKLIKEATVKIVLIIDQFEEIFTNRAFSKEQKEQFINIINIFVKSGYFWVFASMRSDFIKDADDLPRLKELLSHKESRYLLSFPSVSQTRELIIKPSLEAGVGYERKDGKDLDEVLLENATKNGTSLPLLEYVLEELYIARDEENLLTFASYEKMGEIEGAVGQKAEAVYNNLASNGKKAFESLIRMLVTISQKDNRQKSAKTITYDSIKDNKEKVNIIELMSSKNVRLFVKDRDSSGNIAIRVAHEALFNNWDRAVKIISTSGQDIIIRERLEKLSYDWKNTDKKDKKSLLLNDGLPINEALDLVSRRRDELSSDILSFIENSQDRVKQKRWQKRGVLVAGVIGLFVIYSSMQNAKVKEELAQKSKEEAQKLAEYMLNDLRDKLVPIGRVDILQDMQMNVGKYLQQVDEQNGSMQDNIDINIDKAKKQLLESFQEAQETSEEQTEFENHQYMQNIHQERIRRSLVKNEINDKTKMNFLTKIQLEINKYLESTNNQDTSLKTLSLRARSHSNQGEIYELKGKSEEALKEYFKAVDFYKKLIELEPDNSKWNQGLANMYDHIGLIYDHDLSDLQVALKFFQEALEIKNRLIKVNPTNIIWQYDISMSYIQIAAVYMNQGKIKEAEELYKGSLKIKKKLAELKPNNNNWQNALATNYRQIGYIYYTKLEFKESLQMHIRAREIRETLIIIDPNNNLWKFKLSRSHMDFGLVYLKQGVLLDKQKNKKEAQKRYNISEIEYKESLKIYKELVEFSPDNTDWLVDLSLNYIQLGIINQYRNNLQKAIKQFQQAQNIYTKLLTIDSNNTTWKNLLSANYLSMARIYRKDKKMQEALIAYNDSLEIKQKLVSYDSNNLSWQDHLAITYEEIGNMHEEIGNLKEALVAYNNSVKTIEKLVMINSNNIEWYIHLTRTYQKIGRIYLQEKNLNKALIAYLNQQKHEKILVDFESNNINRQNNLAITNYNIGGIYLKLKEPLEALQQYKDSLEIANNLITHNPKNNNLQKLLYKTLKNIGKIYTDSYELEEVENLLELYKWLIELAPKSKYFQEGIAWNYIYLFSIERKATKYLEDAVAFMQKLKDDGYLHEDNFELLETFKGLLG